ncbi:hypothetical protein [Desulfatirhabdium butyrativorans]|uniref:hypothetical protein n=1 Tax=Desulfatirhabdium butyrativorans TaxID=340467 RepID=UPI00048312E7|nr:hypothetical protein [Desulfatirhabdium butyrativorans]
MDFRYTRRFGWGEPEENPSSERRIIGTPDHGAQQAEFPFRRYVRALNRKFQQMSMMATLPWSLDVKNQKQNASCGKKGVKIGMMFDQDDEDGFGRAEKREDQSLH